MKQEEWKEYKLGDILTLEYGKPVPDKECTNGNVPVYGTNGLIGTSHLAPLCKIPSVIIGRKGAYRGVHYSPIPFSVIDTGFYVNPISNDFDMKWLYYKLLTFDINRMDSGSAIPSTDRYELYKLAIKLPPLAEQQRIAGILGSLDDKIELNNAINKNLEQQAGALFKNWFIDYQPFGGVMPAGWREVPLEELCSVITKGTTPTTLGKQFTEYGINFIKGESIQENHSFDIQKISHIDEDTNNLLKRSIIFENDILFTIAGTLGRFAMVDSSLVPANTNQAVGIIRADVNKISPYYLYSFFLANWHIDYYTKRIQQAVQANLSLTTIKALPILILDRKSYEKYVSVITPLLKQLKQNEIENQQLASIRDSLLSKLMSEKDLNEATKKC